MSKIRSLAAGTALVLALAACGSESSTAETATASGDAGETSPTGPPITGSFATVAGGQVDLGALEGQDTVLWFWAPW